MHQETINSFYQAVFTNEIQVISAFDYWTSQYLEWTNRDFDNQQRKMNLETNHFIFLNPSKAIIQGHLLGGCLDTIVEIKAESFFPSLNAWKGAIIFLETSESKMTPEAFAQSLRLLSAEINACNGIIFG